MRIPSEFAIKDRNIGVRCDGNDTDERQFTPLSRALACAKDFFEARLSPEEFRDLLSKVEETKVPDLRGRNPEGIVEVDRYIELVLTQYSRLSSRAYSNVEDLFVAADVPSLSHPT